MAEENIIGSIGTTAWSWWLGLLTALDPNTLNDPIMATISALVFGVVFYIILAIVFERFRDQLGDRAEGILKWATLLMTVGFVLAMIYDGMVYIASTMISLITIVGVVGFGLMVLYFFYAHAKKGIGAAAAVSRSAGRSPGKWAWDIGKNLHAEYKKKKDVYVNEKSETLENHKLLSRLRQDYMRETDELTKFRHLKNLVDTLYRVVGVKHSGEIVKRYLSAIVEDIDFLLAKDKKDIKEKLALGITEKDINTHLKKILKDEAVRISTELKAAKEAGVDKKSINEMAKELNNYQRELQGIEYKNLKKVDAKIDSKIEKLLKERQNKLKKLRGMLSAPGGKLYNWKPNILKVINDLEQNVIYDATLLNKEYRNIIAKQKEIQNIIAKINGVLEKLRIEITESEAKNKKK